MKKHQKKLVDDATSGGRRILMRIPHRGGRFDLPQDADKFRAFLDRLKESAEQEENDDVKLQRMAQYYRDEIARLKGVSNEEEGV